MKLLNQSLQFSQFQIYFIFNHTTKDKVKSLTALDVISRLRRISHFKSYSEEDYKGFYFTFDYSISLVFWI